MWSALLLSALIAAAASAAPVDDDDSSEYAASKEYVTNQRAVLRLFAKIQQPELIPEHEEALKSFKWESIKDKFKDPTFVEHFAYWYEHDVFLGRNKDFSITDVAHFWQFEQLFKLLLSANDFDTFWKAAVWARSHLNERMFAHALYSVLHHRKDTMFMMVPPPYEVFPQYFVSSDVMQQAYDAHLRGLATKSDEPFVIRAYYTGEEALDDEAALSYFREDVGLASYWASFGCQNAFWLDSSESAQPLIKYRGQFLYVLLRNLLARYDMERYSRGLPPVWPVDLWEPVEGYNPEIRHQSGHEFPARPEGLKAKSTDELSLEDLMDWERRVRDGVAMSIYLDDKVHIKNLTEDNAMETIALILKGGEDSPNTKYYGSVFYGLLTIFGHLTDPYQKYGVPPSALQIPETMTRDPLFYRILKRMWTVMDGYKDSLPPYRKEDLILPGVKIESMRLDKLVTFFDDFGIHVDNAIDVQSIEEAGKVNVVVRQQRLNHRPFTFSLKVSSDREMTAVVRLFMGPNDGSGKIWTQDHLRDHFFLLDAFTVKLKKGESDLLRFSKNMFLIGQEPDDFRQMLGRMEAALQGGRHLVPYVDKLNYDGFPVRLLLPQGRRGGLPVTLFAIVTESKGSDYEDQAITDGKDPFFPFDRMFFPWELPYVPNAHEETVQIFHRDVKDLNDTNE